MATPNYSYEKRQRELAKKRKVEEKRQRKLGKVDGEGPAIEGGEAAEAEPSAEPEIQQESPPAAS